MDNKTPVWLLLQEAKKRQLNEWKQYSLKSNRSKVEVGGAMKCIYLTNEEIGEFNKVMKDIMEIKEMKSFMEEPK